MADPVELKARVRAYLDQLTKERAAAAITYAAELARLDAQILATQQVLDAWDLRVDGLIDKLTAAGIQVTV